MSMMRKVFGWQSAPLTGLQKSFAAPETFYDGGRLMSPLIVIDDRLQKGEPGHEVVVQVVKSELSQSIIEMEQRQDPRVLPSDAALVDSGRIRKGLAMHLYPDCDLSGGAGTDMIKSGERDEDGNVISEMKKAYRAFGADKTRSGSELRKAAAELDAMVERVRSRR
jgi:hypothetical protein